MTMANGEMNIRWVRWAGWSGAAGLIAAPLVAMKVAPQSGVDWSAGDFLFAAALLGVIGLMLELAVRRAHDWAYPFGALIGIGTGALMILSNLAVGYIGDGSAPINLVLLAIPVVALVASICVGGKAGRLAVIMALAALAHAIAGAIGYRQDTRTGLITLVFVALWSSAAALFRKSGR
ncbi:hypothetical protein G7077_06565 [Sphingomonas piscis]|uniref:Uncharacterized protein n=1 Tax=Sphingomonas piscis TaxID=2714943 RepID=A0A6G7YPF1_9SPHN|nr:hypothetical protein [Sphingomonas piscis]QIK78606.1 hypothetical protein G7077_06565 [Sphingomonas piscis]